MPADKTSPKESDLVITRIFAAPRDLVFKVWTEPKHILNWWGPKGFTAPVCKVDLRPGGEFLYCMEAPDGKQYWNKGVFHEIVRPEKTTSSIYFSDEKGNIVESSFYGMKDFPYEMRDVVTFEVIDGDSTMLTLRRNHSVSLAERFGEVQGWNQSLDKFTEELAASKGMRNKGKKATSKGNEIRITRVYNAPVHRYSKDIGKGSRSEI